MKLFKAFLTVTIVASGFQAMAYTKGQKVFALTKSRYEKNDVVADFSKPYEIIDVDGENVVAYRRDIGTRTLSKDDIYLDKKSLENWWLDDSQEEPIKAKLPSITKGTALLTYTWDSQKTGQPEQRRVSRILESGYGSVFLIFENGTYQAGVNDSFVVDNPKTGLQGLPDYDESPRIGDVVTSAEALQKWHDENQYKEINTRLVEKVPVAKISALAFRVEYGRNVIALAQVGTQWVDLYHVRPLVTSAYGVKTGDAVYAEYQRFDLRVEQIFRDTYNPDNQMEYDVILTGGENIVLTRETAKKLLSARVCKGDGAKHDLVCKQYRAHLEELKQMSAIFECKLNDKVITLDLKKKTMVYPGGKVSEGRAVTTDIFEWIAEVPAEDVYEKGNTVKARVRLDYNKFNYLYFVLNKQMDNQVYADCMPKE